MTSSGAPGVARYATTSAKGLAAPCAGPHVGSWVGGGKRQQLYSLRRNIHPATGARLPLPISEHNSGDLEVGVAARFGAPAASEPEAGSALAVADRGAHMSNRMLALLQRVRAKEAAGKSAAVKRRLRSKTTVCKYLSSPGRSSHTGP